jgi:3-oxoacyl-[acyl-carrier protein] reductase
MTLEGAKVLVTGGSAGIGLAIAKAMIERGARVAIAARSEERLRAVAKEIGAVPIVADMAVEEDAVRCVAEAAKALGGLDVLVNNAGVGARGQLHELDAAAFRSVWETNVVGAALAAREAAKIFREQRRGDLVNIASTSGTKGYAGGTAYCASKFALRGMTECWQAELRPFNVRVISVCPSEVQTEFGGRKRESFDPKKLLAEDIAHSVVAALEMEPRGFIPEFRVFATNPWPDSAGESPAAAGPRAIAPALSAKAPPASPPSARRAPLGLIIGLLILALSYGEMALPPRPHDDAYITYRYAANVAAGKGLVYNEGERVLGTTTPLYALILAAGAVVGLPIPWFSALIEIASTLAIGVCLFLILRRIRAPGMGVAMVWLYALNRWFFGMALGMESQLYAACLMGAFASLAHGRLALAAPLCGAAAWLRPDGAFAFAALFAAMYQMEWSTWRRDRRFLLALVGSVGVLAIWLLFATLYYGSPIPHSLSAKAAQHFDPGRRQFADGLAHLFLFGPDGARVRPFGVLALAGLAIGLFRRTEIRPVVAWLAAYVGAFTMAPEYQWYYAPVVPVATLGAGLGLLEFARLARWACRGDAKGVAAFMAVAAFLLLFRDLAISGGLTLEYWRHPKMRTLDAGYADAGDWLRANSPPGATVSSVEIGALGYRSERRIVDLMGLVSPEALPSVSGRTPAERAAKFLADYHVESHLPPRMNWPAAMGSRFADAYEVAHEIPYRAYLRRDGAGRPIADLRRAIVFKRRDVVGPAAAE